MARLLSTRARAQLWKLQEEVRMAMRERERLLRILSSIRTSLTPSAYHELWMEFSCADQEYRHAVAQLQQFCEKHGESATV
jgi:hypothetical protein